MNADNYRSTGLFDLLRVTMVLNSTILVGIILIYFNLNKFIVLIIMLTMSLVLSYNSQKVFAKKFGLRNMISDSKIFFIVTLAINIIIAISYLLAGEYKNVIMLVLFYIFVRLWLKRSLKKKIIRKSARRSNHD